jgi:hypothetical protein
MAHEDKFKKKNLLFKTKNKNKQLISNSGQEEDEQYKYSRR